MLTKIGNVEGRADLYEKQYSNEGEIEGSHSWLEMQTLSSEERFLEMYNYFEM